MLRRIVFFLACLAGLPASAARAHFVWIDLANDQTGAPEARLYFNESPEPGESHLIEKIAGTRAWTRGVDGKPTDLHFAPSADEKLAARIAPLMPASPQEASLEASFDYGVYERGPGVLLYYYAKHLPDAWNELPLERTRALGLKLDIVPRLQAGKLDLQVFFDGQSDAEREVVVLDAVGKSHTLKTDDQGQASLAGATAGRYAVRAAHIDAGARGQREEKKYAQTWHYATLTFKVPEARENQAADNQTTAIAAAAVPPTDATGKESHEQAANPAAAEALKRARAGRSIWENFPGFTAEVVVDSGTEQLTGTVRIKDDGSVYVDLPQGPLANWAEEQLQSVVQHRMPDGEVNTGKVTFTEEKSTHPLGRQIDLGDPELESRYRLKDDVILEVSRKAGPMRFVISVLETVRNAEGKYLPRAFTMNFFDGANGQLLSSSGYWNQWQRVGNFDLPETILETSTTKGGNVTRQIVLKNCRLTEKK